MVREADDEYVVVGLTVDANAGSLAHEAAAPSIETDCCNKDWTGASVEDIVGGRKGRGRGGGGEKRR